MNSLSAKMKSYITGGGMLLCAVLFLLMRGSKLYVLSFLALAITVPFVKNYMGPMIAMIVHSAVAIINQISDIRYAKMYFPYELTGAYWFTCLLDLLFAASILLLALYPILEEKNQIKELVKKFWFLPAALYLVMIIINYIRHPYFWMLGALMDVAYVGSLFFLGNWVVEDAKMEKAGKKASSASFNPQPNMTYERKLFCPGCGREFGPNERFCAACGRQRPENRTPMGAQNMQNTQNMQNAQSAPAGYQSGNTVDEMTTVLKFVCFFVPLAGLILYFIWKEETPIRAKECGKFALIGFGVGIALTVVLNLIPIIVFHSMI